MDKLRDLREDKAIKKGYLQKPLRIKESNINLTRSLNHRPTTIFADTVFENPNLNFFSRNSYNKGKKLKKFVHDTKADVAYSTDVVYVPSNRKVI